MAVDGAIVDILLGTAIIILGLAFLTHLRAGR